MDESFESENDMDMGSLLIPEVCLNVEEDAAPLVLNGDSKLSECGSHNGEVVDIDDITKASKNSDASCKIEDTADANQENEHPGQIPDPYNLEEVVVFHDNFREGQQYVQTLKLHCTACNTHLGSAPSNPNRYVHPLLKVLICKKCYDFYGSGDFEKDEDGSELYCRWCGQGGSVLCCSQCPHVFCQRCIRSNMGGKILTGIKNSDDWTCFVCKPLQIINLRVTCRALYDFVQSEKRINALNPERLKIDHSLCCVAKAKVVPIKRKRSNSNDDPYKPHVDNTDSARKRKKLKANVLVHADYLNNENKHMSKVALAGTLKNWESQVEDEVVCTPDLSMLFDVDGTSTGTPSGSPKPWPPVPTLTPISKLTAGNSNTSDKVKYNIGQTTVSPTSKAHSLATRGYVLPPMPVVLTTSTTRPLTANSILKNITPPARNKPNTSNNNNTHVNMKQGSVVITQTRKNPGSTKAPIKLLSGLKYEWFDKATQVTATVNQNLTSRLSTLSASQKSVTSLAELANVHNSLQEILSNSINSLMKIRSNLRTDFIAGLKKLKFQEKQNVNNDDNDVIIVESTLSQPTTNLNSRAADSVIITIPDTDDVEQTQNSNGIQEDKDHPIDLNDVVEVQNEDPLQLDEVPEKQNEEKPDKTSSNSVNTNDDVNPDDVSTNDVTTDANTNDGNTNDDFETMCDPETLSLIKRAVVESKFEAIVNENIKIKTKPAISPTILKNMLSVRVVVDTNYGPGSPRVKPHKGYRPMQIAIFDHEDIEALLSPSIVINTAKRKVFENTPNNSSIDDDKSDAVEDKMDNISDISSVDDLEQVEEADRIEDDLEEKEAIENEDEEIGNEEEENVNEDNEKGEIGDEDEEKEIEDEDEEKKTEDDDEEKKIEDEDEKIIEENMQDNEKMEDMEEMSENEEESTSPDLDIRTSNSGIYVDNEQNLNNANVPR